MTKLKKHFSKERDNLKTLKEIKSDIRKLLNDHWYELSKKEKEIARNKDFNILYLFCPIGHLLFYKEQSVISFWTNSVV